MKTSILLKSSVAVIALSLSAACSSIGGGTKSGQDLAQRGPTVVSVESQPKTIELNPNWQAAQKPMITAQVKDFTSSVTDVRLRFLRAPLEIPMKNVGGTTWQASLTDEQVKTLAVGGETMTYEANVVAKNQDGLIALSQDPVQIVVKAPDQQAAGEAGFMEAPADQNSQQ